MNAWQVPAGRMASRSLYALAVKRTWDRDWETQPARLTTPPVVPDLPIGTWRIDATRGLHGRLVEQLRIVRTDEIQTLRTHAYLLAADSQAVIRRIADWLRAGHAVLPIDLVESAGSTLSVVRGFAWAMAARRAGLDDLPCWVSPVTTVPGLTDLHGAPIFTGLTHELAIRHALAHGRAVPAEVLTDYPDLAGDAKDLDGSDPITDWPWSPAAGL